MGSAYANKGEYEKAIKSYKKSIEINPKHDNAYYNIGSCYEDLEEYEKAIESYQKAIELNPEKNEEELFPIIEFLKKKLENE